MISDKKLDKGTINQQDINEENDNKIFFISTSKKYFELSNFYESEFNIDEIIYRTIEHYFQSQKFFLSDIEYAYKIINAETSKKAKSLGRGNSKNFRKDWEANKVDIMYEGLKAKFNQNKELKQLLLSTKDKELIENNRGDSFWGCGRNGKGKNMQGKLLMKLREELS